MRRWGISDPRWDSHPGLRFLRLLLLGLWSAFAFAWVVGAVHAGSINKGAVTRETTPWTFWFVMIGVATAGCAVLWYNIYLFRRGMRKPE